MFEYWVSGSFHLILTYKFSIVVSTGAAVKGIAAARIYFGSLNWPQPYLLSALYLK